MNDNRTEQEQRIALHRLSIIRRFAEEYGLTHEQAEQVINRQWAEWSIG